jgi:hypothetical protein
MRPIVLVRFSVNQSAPSEPVVIDEILPPASVADLPEPKFVTARSGLLSAFRSPTATEERFGRRSPEPEWDWRLGP